MPNGDALNEQLEFEERMKSMSPDDRTIFIAKQVYSLTNKMDGLTGIGVSKKAVATTSGITTAIVIGVVEALKLIVGKG